MEQIFGRVNSLLKNYYLLLYAAHLNTSVTLKRTDGSDYSFNPGGCRSTGTTRIISCLAPEEVTSWGILIGTSDIAVSPTDYKLGELFSCWYSAVTISELNGASELEITRYFLNDSSDVYIREFGLAEHHRVLILRDVISPLSFPKDYSLLIKLKFSF